MSRNSERSQVVLVTGAADGIGAAIAALAVARGHRVMLTDVNGEAVHSAARRLGDRAAGCVLDIRDPEGWAKAFDATEAQLGAVDVLINNAGITHTGHARDLSLQQHRDIVEVNLLGTITGVHTALRRMTERGSGHIINVCSMTSFLPLPGYSTYGASKYAMRGFHHSVALEERNGPWTSRSSTRRPPGRRCSTRRWPTPRPRSPLPRSRTRRSRSQGRRRRDRLQTGRGGVPAPRRTLPADRRCVPATDALGAASGRGQRRAPEGAARLRREDPHVRRIRDPHRSVS